MRSGKRHITEGITLLNKKKIRRSVKKENLQVLEEGTIKQVEMKEKNWKTVFQERKNTRDQTIQLKFHESH